MQGSGANKGGTTEESRKKGIFSPLPLQGRGAGGVRSVVPQQFDERTLLIADKEGIIIDVVHEALIRHWGRLRKWQDEYKAAMVIERKIEASAQEWEEKDKKNEYLLQGTRLGEALEYVKAYDKLGMLDGVAEDYIEKSINNDRRNRRNRRLIIGGVVGVVGVAAVVSTFFGIDSRRQATIATLREQATNVQLLLSLKPVDSLALAIDTTGKSQSSLHNVLSEVQSSLSDGIEIARERNLFQGHESYVNSVAFSPDGKTIVSGSADNTVRLWDLSGKPIAQPFKGHESYVYSVAFSPDGKTIVSGSDDQTVRLWRGGNWQAWLKVGCDRLRLHPVFISRATDNPEITQGAIDTCLKDGDWTNGQKAEFFARQGLALIQEKGDIDGAKNKFKRANQLDSDHFKLAQLETEMKALAPSVLEKGKTQVQQGEVDKALTLYKNAQKLDPNLKIDAESWDTLCWYGSLYRRAKDVLFACENAVKLAPDAERKAYSTGSRGFAKALIGDKLGAIADFQVFIDSPDLPEEAKAERKQWIEALKQGKDPFTDEVLNKMKQE